ncbi:MAG: hypothetical protein K9L19_15895 [Desulfarculaceae bacterium]|nr:hypothetical protein [Desulfarculaceae bacterium]MCF8049030.1 hypothetical protein [Desulfarculaceae bacterium]MCF8122846.1 hypothetical protein [Desulfarculaceae bacterium]
MEPTIPQAIAPKVPQEEMAMEQRIAAAKLLMVELEGGLTDGVSYLSADGSESLALYRADVLGLESWLKAGRMLVIVARPGLAVAEELASRLGATLRTSGGDKDILFKQVTWEQQVKSMEAVYLGRDFDDLPALGLAGLAVCPPESPMWVRGMCHMVTEAPAGRGAVREVVDLLLADYVPEEV